MGSLYQDETWTTREGDTLGLEDMTPSHRRNLLAYLDRNAGSLEIKYAMHVDLPMAARIGVDEPWFDDMMDERSDHPDQWLRETPLYKRLAKMVAEDDGR